jgi:CDP-paratose synthetase
LIKTILITGINGYLGSKIAKELSSSFNIVGLEYDIDDLFRVKKCNYHIYSSRQGVPEEVFINHAIDCVIHTATLYGRGSEILNDMLSANLIVPLEILDKAIENGSELFINTDTVLERFVNAYSLTKRHFQEWLFARSDKIKVVNMRLEHFYGAGASESNFVTNMINQLYQNVESIDLTSGEQTRYFVYIDDVVSAFKVVVEKYDTLDKNFSELYVSTSDPISIKQLVISMKEHLDSKTVLNFGALAARSNEDISFLGDSSILDNLGWKPRFNMNAGLIQTIKNSIVNFEAIDKEKK